MRLLLALLAAALTAFGQPDKVDFARDVQPLLLSRCGSCHIGDRPQAGLRLHTRADILKGGQSGPAIVPGSSRDSLLIQRVTGFAAPVMPQGGEPLSDREIEMLRAWIDQGAPGPTGQPDEGPIRSLVLRKPETAGVEAYFARHGIAVPPPVSDALFARRVYFDVWGLPPTPAEWQDFVGDPRPDKRERLVDRLLADNKKYAEHWISFWNDLLRNDEGVIYHGARQSISTWLLRALEDNLPYDRFVSALLNPRDSGDPAGFLIGVNWRGDVSASQIPPMQAAQNSAQIFLGVNLKCNSCHDSFISRWKLKDAYGMASFFSEKELEIYRCDASTGETSSPQFLFPEIGAVEAGASLADRRAAAARFVTAPENGRFARTIVNRIWKRLMGRGLVEPVDEMDNDPWDPDLLDWLAADFVEHGYDLKLLLRRIMTSPAYQLPAVGLSSGRAFRGPLVRRLTAEQYVDAISSITGEWRLLEPSKPGVATPSREWRLKSSPLTRALGRPIRDQVYTERSNDPATLQALELVNGETMTHLLHRGAQRMLGVLKAPPQNLFDSGIVRSEKIDVDIDITGARELRLLIEDADSYDRTRVVAGWADAELVSPRGVTRLADLATASKVEKRPLRIRKQDYSNSLVPPASSEIVYDIADTGYTRFRAVVGVDESSLQSDISPRVRFFVFTEEPDRERLVRVAEDAVPTRNETVTADSLITRLYRHGLSRDPTPEERRVAQEFLIGMTSEGLEDLLWSLFLSPEFQYIH